MKLDVQAVLSDLKAKSLPMVERDLIIAVDSVVSSIGSQAVAQAAAGDSVAAVVAIVAPILKQAIDAEAAVLLPDAAKA